MKNLYLFLFLTAISACKSDVLPPDREVLENRAKSYFILDETSSDFQSCIEASYNKISSGSMVQGIPALHGDFLIWTNHQPRDIEIVIASLDGDQHIAQAYSYDANLSLSATAMNYFPEQQIIKVVDSRTSELITFDLAKQTVSSEALPAQVISAFFDESRDVWIALVISNKEDKYYQEVRHYDREWKEVGVAVKVEVPTELYTLSASQLKIIDDRYYVTLAASDHIYDVTNLQATSIYQLAPDLSTEWGLEDYLVTPEWVWHPINLPHNGRRRMVWYDRKEQTYYLTTPGHANHIKWSEFNFFASGHVKGVKDGRFVELISNEHIRVLKEGLDHREMLDNKIHLLPSNPSEFLVQSFKPNREVIKAIRK